MPNTPTTNFGLLKPALGDQNWNVPTNSNWDSVDNLLLRVLNAQGPTGTLTGTGVAQAIYTYTVPGGAIPAGKGIRITTYFNHTGGSAGVAYLLTFGGQTFTTFTITDTAVKAEKIDMLIFNNAGVTNAQSSAITLIETGGTTTIISDITTGTVDTTVNQILTLTFNVAATDTVQGRLWLVEALI